MITKQILTLTLLVSALTLNAAIPTKTYRITKQRSNTLSSGIASTLHKRGIDEDKALELAEAFVGKDEGVVSLMIQNYLSRLQITQEELFTQLSKLALLQKKVDFTSYSSLVKITQSINMHSLDANMLQTLATIAKVNRATEELFV